MLFILQFQEQAFENVSTQIVSGTLTTTAVKAEQKDTDINFQGYNALQQEPCTSGTMTGTRIRAEAPDSDPTTPKFTAFPLSILK